MPVMPTIHRLRAWMAWLPALALLGTTAPALASDNPGQEPLRIGTASPGGTYAVYGEGLARLISQELGVDAVPESTGGPYHNMALVHSGDVELGLTTLGPAREAWQGESDVAPGVEMRDVRALFPMYQTPFQVITLADSGIEQISDLAGRRVGVGPMGGTCANYWPRFLEALGVEDVQYQYDGANQLADYVAVNLVDAFAFCAGLPIQAFLNLEERHDVHLFAFSEEEQALLVERFPVARFDIPADTYASQEAVQHSVAFWNFAIGHKDLSDDLVHDLMARVLEHPSLPEALHPAATDTRAEHLDRNTVMWFHPGAIRYYRDQGHEVDAERIPPEAE